MSKAVYLYIIIARLFGFLIHITLVPFTLFDLKGFNIDGLPIVCGAVTSVVVSCCIHAQLPKKSKNSEY